MTAASWKPGRWFWILESTTWVGFVLFSTLLYDRWLIPGPHGLFPWVGMDFVPYWVGVRSMLAGQSPYHIETTRLIQTTLLGGAVAPGQDPMMFVYPAWLFLPLLPIALLPLKWAVAVWVGTILLWLVNFLGYLSIQWGNKKPWHMALWWLALVAGALPFIAIGGTKGQLGLISMFLLFLVLRYPGKDSIWSGVLLALALLKPIPSIFPVAAYLFFAAIEHKGKILASFCLTLGILFFASWMAVGNWMPDYVNLLKDTGGAPILWSFTSLSSPWNFLFIGVFICLFIFSLFHFLKSHRFHAWFSSSVLVGMVLLPMRWIYDLFFGFLCLTDIRRPRGWMAVLVVIALFMPWFLLLVPVPGRWDAMIICLPAVWAILWMVNFVQTTAGGVSCMYPTQNSR